MKLYSLLIVTAKSDAANRNANKLYANHHVFAVCQSESRGDLQDNSASNTAKLTHAEHYEAHRLLHLIYPKSSGLAIAFFLMSHKKNRVKVDAEAYASARALHGSAASDRMSKYNLTDANPAKSEKNRAAQSNRSTKQNSLEHSYAKSEANRIRLAEYNRSEHSYAKSEANHKRLSEYCKSEHSYAKSKRHRELMSSELNPGKSEKSRAAASKTFTEYAKSEHSYGKSEANSKRMSNYNSRQNKVEHACPVCGLVGKGPNMKRYHFSNCKHFDLYCQLAY